MLPIIDGKIVPIKDDPEDREPSECSVCHALVPDDPAFQELHAYRYHKLKTGD